MRAWTIAVLTLGVVALSVLPVAAQATSAAAVDAKPGGIRGRITAADTGKPLRRARVTITTPSGPSGARPLVANTNAIGQFELKDLQPGLSLLMISGSSA